MVYFLCKAYDSDRQNCYFALSLPVRGAWIEMIKEHENSRAVSSRSPCGERGLKSAIGETVVITKQSLPVRGAWIEMSRAKRKLCPRRRRSPCGERGLKSSSSAAFRQSTPVAPRAGSVD